MKFSRTPLFAHVWKEIEKPQDVRKSNRKAGGFRYVCRRIGRINQNATMQIQRRECETFVPQPNHGNAPLPARLRLVQ